MPPPSNAPNFKEVEGPYWFGPVPGSVCLACYICIWSKTGRDRILKFGMWNKYEKEEDLFLFSFSSDFSLQSYAPVLTFLFTLPL